MNCGQTGTRKGAGKPLSGRLIDKDGEVDNGGEVRYGG